MVVPKERGPIWAAAATLPRRRMPRPAREAAGGESRGWLSDRRAERELEELHRVEEALVAAAIVVGHSVYRSPSAPPAALLGVRAGGEGFAGRL